MRLTAIDLVLPLGPSCARAALPRASCARHTHLSCSTRPPTPAQELVREAFDEVLDECKAQDSDGIALTPEAVSTLLSRLGLPLEESELSEVRNILRTHATTVGGTGEGEGEEEEERQFQFMVCSSDGLLPRPKHCAAAATSLRALKQALVEQFGLSVPISILHDNELVSHIDDLPDQGAILISAETAPQRAQREAEEAAAGASAGEAEAEAEYVLDFMSFFGWWYTDGRRRKQAVVAQKLAQIRQSEAEEVQHRERSATMQQEEALRQREKQADAWRQRELQRTKLAREAQQAIQEDEVAAGRLQAERDAILQFGWQLRARAKRLNSEVPAAPCPLRALLARTRVGSAAAPLRLAMMPTTRAD